MVGRFGRQTAGMIVGIVLLAAAILFNASVNSSVLTAQAPDAAVEPAALLAVSQVLSYQGRLLSPSTGQPKADGDYQMTFSIYNVATAGSPLWTETKSVTVSNGFFATLLGDTTTLTSSAFNGQELFLGITLAGDAEMTPRQRLAHSAYAMFAENAGNLNGIASTGFATASHNHDGAAINSGTVAEARIDGALARDNEVMGIVLGNDGASSGLDADLLDGQSSTAFAAASHTHMSVPVAYAFINADGTKSAGTSNVSSTWEAANNRYRIAIAGENYFYSSYVTVVTTVPTAGCEASTASTSSVSNALLVIVYGSNDAARQCPFQFLTFKP